MSPTGPSSPPDVYRLRVAIASDLHAYASAQLDGQEPPSHLEVLSGDASPNTNPIVGLKQLIQGEGLSADLLLCPGDLGDRASREGIQFAWQKIHEIGGWLGVKLVVATTGNHDVDSRHRDGDPDPHQILKDLDPPYPTPDETQNDKYFARDFVILDGENYRLVLLNSSAHHGSGEHEHNHGLITRQTLSKLKIALSSASEKCISILLCHHHPHHHSELNLGSADLMKDGQLLLDVLGNDQGRPWLVIHGHKHHPKITYAAGGTTSPVVFAAGSLSASLFKELQTAARNQFHVVDLEWNAMAEHGFVGRVQTWYWAFGEGWRPSNPASGLPRQTGFGFRGDIRVLARRVQAEVGEVAVLWSDLVQLHPELQYLLPQDFGTLRAILRNTYGVGIHEQDGLPYQVGRNSQ